MGCLFDVGPLVFKWENNIDWIYIPSFKEYANINAMKYQLNDIIV